MKDKKVYKGMNVIYDMKKFGGLFLLSLIFLSLSSSFVSAASVTPQKIQIFVNNSYEVVRPFFEVIIGESTYAETFLAKILFLSIILIIVYLALSKVAFFTGNKWALWIVTIAVSILSIRWFGDSYLVQTALLPSSALGVTIVCGLPFIIYSWIVKDFVKTARRFAWILFMVIFIALWSARADAVGDYAYIYLVTGLLGLGMLIFDGAVQKYMVRARGERIRAGSGSKLMDKLNDEIEDADKRYAAGGITEAQHTTRVRNAQRKMNKLIHDLGGLP